MHPTRPPVPPPSGKAYSSESMHVPLPLYGMHVNAAVAGPSTLLPRSNTSPTSLYQRSFSQQQRTSQAPPLPSKPPALSAPLPASLMPGSTGRSRPGVLSELERSLLFQSSTMTLSGFSSNGSIFPKPTSYSENAPPGRPRIPPKPHLHTQPSAALPRENSPAPTIPPKPARALELSLVDSGMVGRPDLEDETLARALEESINTPPIHDARAYEDSDSRPQELTRHSLTTSSSQPCESTTSTTSFVETPPTSSYSYSTHEDASDRNSPHVSADADLNELVKQEEFIRAGDEARRRQMEMDEEFARNIARMEGDVSLPPPSFATPPATTPPTGFPFPSVDPSTPPVNNAMRPYSVHTGAAFQQGQERIRNPLPHVPTLGSVAEPPAPPYERLGRSVSAQAAIPSVSDIGNYANAAAPRLSLPPYATRPDTLISVQNRPRSVFSQSDAAIPNGRPAFDLEVSIRTSNAGSSIGPPPSEEAEMSVTNGNESPMTSPVSVEGSEEGRLVSNSNASSPPIVEEELLLGVSFGFTAPPLTTSRDIMHGPIPNIITLPYGKFPPLHIQAPTWKHLIKLLARLSDSRIEPTVEALAATKSELKLRTVIQFMKMHHASTDWRTIIYLTIDVPTPPPTPETYKYTNGDVNTLPYSYTLSPLPALLRAGAGDSNLSKCFTVPATPNIPYPTLPMTLPDLALYLLAVLDDSRRAAGDSSGGLRKLAKIIDSLYPADALAGVGPELDAHDKRGVSKFFRRLGRGNKESQNQRGGNAERFEFITPFRIDEYH